MKSPSSPGTERAREWRGRLAGHGTGAIFGSKAQQARTQHQIDIDRLLLSQDVFLKMMLSHYGGFGYAYVLRHFLPRLKRHGVSDAAISVMLIDNPREVFHAA